MRKHKAGRTTIRVFLLLALVSLIGVFSPVQTSLAGSLDRVRPDSARVQMSQGCSYRVQQGDNLYRIALRYRVSYAYMARANGIRNPSFILRGTVLRVPCLSAANSLMRLSGLSTGHILFDTFGDDQVSTGAIHTLKGDEFQSQGITLAAVPEGAQCARAAMLIHPAIGREYPYRFLGTADPNDMTQCNDVSIGINFTSPVRLVRLTFVGQRFQYLMSAFDNQGALLRMVGVGIDCCATIPTLKLSLSYDTASISRVVFAHEQSMTAIKEIYYER